MSMPKYLLTLLSGLLYCTGGAYAAADLSERDYFSELPEVLTVTRLTQPISDTPGAVTIIDRETIRRSGARELADVLRLVPGYLVAGWNGANPGAVYHAPIDVVGSRNLVLVDGRPVYSAFYVGDTHRGMMGVLLEDIERIEVLRGSNSAAYGANAMFGVINIITRHSNDTRGAEASVTRGAGGIDDNHARIGWGDEVASFRLSTGRRKDSGYLNTYDDKIVSQLHFRGDLRPTHDQELMLAAGVTQLSAGEGFPGTLSPSYLRNGNPERTTNWRNSYVHGVWQRQLSATSQLKLTTNFDDEIFRDDFPYWYLITPPVILDISFSGRGRRANVELQHQAQLDAGLRVVWGLGYKQEDARSPPLYYRDDAVALHEERVFGNLEWRPHPRLLVNAGGFWGSHNWKGEYFSPRLMANFQLAVDHTLRAGMTESTRMPTLFELAGDVRYYWNGILIGHTFDASGTVVPERLYVREVGYFGNFRDWRLTLDVRGFDERMEGRITGNKGTPQDFINDAEFRVRGFEYQMRWKPLPDTEVWLNQAFTRLIWANGSDTNQPPGHVTTAALFQKLPDGFDLTLLYHVMGAMTWNDQKDSLPPRHRLDARIARQFMMGGQRVEASLAIQAANGSYVEYLPTKNFTFERRAFGTLRLEF